LLHLPPGALTFASRRAYRLAYRSQRVGRDGGIGDPIPKPKGMRWATFDREVQKVEALEAVINGHLWVFVQKLNERLRR